MPALQAHGGTRAAIGCAAGLIGWVGTLARGAGMDAGRAWVETGGRDREERRGE